MSETVEPTDDWRSGNPSGDPLVSFLDAIADQLSIDVIVLRENLQKAEVQGSIISVV